MPLPQPVVDFNYDLLQSITAAEEAGTVSFTVTRGGLTNLTSTVDFATSDCTATAGSDYVATSGTLTFAPGETTKQVMVTILDDAVQESDETVTVTLSNPVNMTILGSAETSPLTITDSDLGGMVGLMWGGESGQSSTNVTTDDESAANATFTITRAGDTIGTGVPHKNFRTK